MANTMTRCELFRRLRRVGHVPSASLLRAVWERECSLSGDGAADDWDMLIPREPSAREYGIAVSAAMDDYIL